MCEYCRTSAKCNPDMRNNVDGPLTFSLAARF
jgi:hypothetical protein